MSSAELKWVRWRARLGFPLVLLSLYFARPTAQSILVGSLLAFGGLLIRGFAAGHLRKTEIVTASGPYAHTRNPLYLGSSIMALGFVIASRSLIVAALVLAYYLAFYPFLMRREERELRALFGKQFDEYSANVPLFWPCVRSRTAQPGKFDWGLYFRNSEYNAFLGMAALIAALWALSVFRP